MPAFAKHDIGRGSGPAPRRDAQVASEASVTFDVVLRIMNGDMNGPESLAKGKLTISQEKVVFAHEAENMAKLTLEIPVSALYKVTFAYDRMTLEPEVIGAGYSFNSIEFKLPDRSELSAIERYVTDGFKGFEKETEYDPNIKELRRKFLPGLPSDAFSSHATGDDAHGDDPRS